MGSIIQGKVKGVKKNTIRLSLHGRDEFCITFRGKFCSYFVDWTENIPIGYVNIAMYQMNCRVQIKSEKRTGRYQRSE